LAAGTSSRCAVTPVFSNGIWALAIMAGVLLVAVNGNVNS
jgi:hypothetical protein